jgi:hypothetical protein
MLTASIPPINIDDSRMAILTKTRTKATDKTAVDVMIGNRRGE